MIDILSVNRLYIHFVPMNAVPAGPELLGKIELLVVQPSGDVIRQVFESMGDLAELAAWFREHRLALLGQRLPIGDEFSSIAEADSRFHERMKDGHHSPEDDRLLDAMHAYRTAHLLSFGLRGVKMPNIYLGRFRDRYEISLWNQEDAWEYEIDLEEFLDEMDALARQFIDWQTPASTRVNAIE